MPRAQRPKAISGSSGSSSESSQVHCASGVKSFTTGMKSASLSPFSARSARRRGPCSAGEARCQGRLAHRAGGQRRHRSRTSGDFSFACCACSEGCRSRPPDPVSAASRSRGPGSRHRRERKDRPPPGCPGTGGGAGAAAGAATRGLCGRRGPHRRYRSRW